MNIVFNKNKKVTIHHNLQSQLLHAIESEKVSHALLFHGKCGYGTLPLALWYAEQLLCKDKSEKCQHKVQTLQHADLHFAYPVTTTDEIKNKPKSADFLHYWRDFVQENPFGNGFDWGQFIGAEKKQGIINVEQSHEILKTLGLRSFEGGYKIMIIWLPENMNIQTANKLLKIIEEPPQKTLFMLVSENAETLLPTIISRCQIIRVPRLSRIEIEEILVQKYNVEPHMASQAAKSAQGDVSIALESLLYKSETFENLFIQWVRNAFRAKKDITALQDIHAWSQEIADWNNRERHKQFLNYCADIFRQALMENYGASDLVFSHIRTENFKWISFAKYIHGANVEEILNEINDASYHIERNGNAKIIFLDMGIKMTRFIHKKETVADS